MANRLARSFRSAGVSFAVGIQCFPLDLLDVKDKDIQPPLGGDLGVFLAERAGGGIPGVFKGLFPGQLLGLHHPFKAFHRHIDLPPDLQEGELVRKRQGHGTDGTDVFGNILSDEPIPPGRTDGQDPVLILQGDGKAINFRLYHIGGVGDCLPHPAVKIPKLFEGKDILKGTHLHLVLHLGKGVGGIPTHPHRGGGGRVVLGIGFLQVQQLMKQLIVFKVRDFRVVQVVVPVGVVLHLGTERFDLLQNWILLGFRHDTHLILT